MFNRSACLFIWGFCSVFVFLLQLKGTKELVETNGHSHEDTNVGTTNLIFALVA